MAIINKQTQRTQEVEDIISYPKLMKHKFSELIVLFNSEGKGVVLVEDINIRSIGEYSSDWIPRAFEDYKGELSLTLQNVIKGE